MVDATENGQATARSIALDAEITDSLDDVLRNDQIQGVALATPAETHAELAIQAMQAGKDVFVEKPMALTVEDAKKMKKVAEETPEKILKAEIDPLAGPQPYQGREMAFKLGLKDHQVKQFVTIFMGLAKLFKDKDLALIEVNPLVITDAGNLHCLDAKVVTDSNALYRHKDLQAMHDPSQEDAREAHAAEWDLNYVALDGNIGCMVNGAGLAMGTMDIVKLHGGAPANFLDVGGGATKERVTEAFKIILSDDNVKAVLINIFGGIVRCDLIAEGVIGMSVEEKKEVTAEFPKDFEVEVLAGKKVVYQLEVHEIREKKAPVLEDENFLKSLKVESVDELKNKISEQIKFRKEQENENLKRKQITQKILDLPDFPLPQQAVEDESKAIFQNHIQRASQQGIKPEELEKNRDDMWKESQTQ
ncbi:MAG: hypothetical protein EBY43_08080, partial [Opitutae bacterium]|nr:hypothetical protein [Opitutae bacterium]